MLFPWRLASICHGNLTTYIVDSGHLATDPQSPFTSQSNTLWPLDFTWIPFSVPQDWLINPSVFPMELQCLLGARPIPTQLEKICSEFLICRKCRWWHLAHLHPQHKFDIAKSSSLFHTQDYVSSSFPTSLLPTSYLSKSRSLAWIWCKSIFHKEGVK
jgi:hypothetical protein